MTYLGPGYGLWKPTFTLDGSTKIFQTVFMCTVDPIDTAASINAHFRTCFASAGRPFVAGNMFVGYTFAKSECYVNEGDVVTYDINESPIVGNKSGSLGTPINTSILIKKNTLLVGRRYQGRHMMPNLFTAEADISQAGIIGSTAITALQALWDAAMTATNLLAGVQTVLGHSTSEVLPTPYDTVVIQPKIGTMRRRIRGF